MEERYKLCDDGMARLLVWISNVEAQLANQDTVREDVAELKNQINVITVCHSSITMAVVSLHHVLNALFYFCREFVTIWWLTPDRSTDAWIRFVRS